MRYILAGGPTCGKTFLVRELRKRGYVAIDEAAREVIEEGRFVPKTLDFQLEIFRRQIERENNAPLPAFFDRSALEGIAYSRKYLPKVPRELDEFDYSGRYSKVFLLERLPFQQDGKRVEKDDPEAEEVHQRIIQAYQERGYPLVHIPIFPGKVDISVAKRADYLLERVGESNGN